MLAITAFRAGCRQRVVGVSRFVGLQVVRGNVYVAKSVFREIDAKAVRRWNLGKQISASWSLVRFGPNVQLRVTKPEAIVRAVPPWVLLRLGQLGKGLAMLLGRNLRNRYRGLPPGDKDKLHRLLVAFFTGSAGFCLLVYFSHIEEAPITGRRRFVLVSRDTVVKMSEDEGEMLVASLAPKVLPPNHPAYDGVRRVARRLLAQSPVDIGLRPSEWRITIVDAEDVNAFVLPCGWIFIFTGMLEMCDNDDRLSAVLAHEMAHCLMGHQQELASQATLLQLLLFIPVLAIWMVLPSDSVSVISSKIADMVSAFFLSLPHSRTMETEADIVGLNLAADACYDVREAAVFWKLMTVKRKTSQEPEIPELLSTHPSHETRVATIEEYLPVALERRAEKGCPLLPAKNLRLVLNLIERAASSAEADGGFLDWKEFSQRFK